MYRELKVWQEALALAERVYRLAGAAKAPEARGLMGRLTDAAGAVPGRIAHAWLRAHAGEDPASLLQQAEGRLLDVETQLLLGVRLGHLEQEAVSRVLSIQQEVLRLLPTLASPPTSAVPPAVVTAMPAQPPAPEPPAPGRPREGVHRARMAPRVTEEYHQPVDRLVVDGCNFLGSAVGYTLGDDRSRDKLLFRLQEYARRHPAHQVVVFFDGQRASRRQTAGVEERVTSGNRPADDVIVEFIEALPTADQPRCTVVTDDRELAQRAKRAGAAAQPVGELVGKLSREAAGFVKREDGLNQSGLADWEEFFSHPPRRPGKQTG